ncbi:iron chelate uptake ABC transporter family permease subunit [Streptomyces sp. NPDC048723]|uniref:iron chelate uptake ABC transporter family permease subunit n=1 Tax=unclassified Streptomyces TaxID=2593676 RepID=UPI0035697FB3
MPAALRNEGYTRSAGLAAAAVVLGLSGLGAGTVRLVLAGSALTLGLSAITEGLLLLFPQQTAGIFRWNQGSIAQHGFDGLLQMAPIGLVALVTWCRWRSSSSWVWSWRSPGAPNSTSCRSTRTPRGCSD